MPDGLHPIGTAFVHPSTEEWKPLPKDIVDLNVKVVFANMRIVVPAGLRVVNRVGAFAANVESEPALDLAPMKPGAPVIRITGNVVFGNIEIVAGHRFPGE